MRTSRNSRRASIPRCRHVRRCSTIHLAADGSIIARPARRGSLAAALTVARLAGAGHGRRAARAFCRHRLGGVRRRCDSGRGAHLQRGVVGGADAGSEAGRGRNRQRRPSSRFARGGGPRERSTRARRAAGAAQSDGRHDVRRTGAVPSSTRSRGSASRSSRTTPTAFSSPTRRRSRPALEGGTWTYVTGLSKSVAAGYRTGFLATSPVARRSRERGALGLGARRVADCRRRSRRRSSTTARPIAIVEWKRARGARAGAIARESSAAYRRDRPRARTSGCRCRDRGVPRPSRRPRARGASCSARPKRFSRSRRHAARDS